MIKFNATSLAAVALAQPKGETRYYLCGVYFTEGNLAVATDGFMLTCARDAENKSDESGIFPISKKAISAMKKRGASSVTIENGLLTVWEKPAYSDPEPRHIEPCKKIDGTFPDWRRVIPSTESTECKAALSHKLLSVIVESSGLVSGRKDAPVSIVGDTNTSPHVVRYDSEMYDVFSVIMPMRFGEQGTPGWYRDSLCEKPTAEAAE